MTSAAISVKVGVGFCDMRANSRLSIGSIPEAINLRASAAAIRASTASTPRGQGAAKVAKAVKSVAPVEPTVAVAMVAPSVLSHTAEMSLVPEKASGYVPFGNFSDVRSIIKSKKFYPAYITGLSGNGKTMMIEQVCAAEKRELVRVNITIETDEDDLIGGFRLVNGETVWQDGPVITAMTRGAALLLG